MCNVPKMYAPAAPYEHIIYGIAGLQQQLIIAQHSRHFFVGAILFHLLMYVVVYHHKQKAKIRPMCQSYADINVLNRSRCNRRRTNHLLNFSIFIVWMHVVYVKHTQSMRGTCQAYRFDLCLNNIFACLWQWIGSEKDVVCCRKTVAGKQVINNSLHLNSYIPSYMSN